MDSSRDSRGIECQSRLAPRKAPGRRSPRCSLRRSQWIWPSPCSRSRCRSGRGRWTSAIASRAGSSRASSAEQAPATVVMEACGTAHFWGREAGARGHRVVLLPPHAVRPYVLRNKTDGADAKGLLEALRNEDDPPGAGEVRRSARARGAASPALGLDGDAHGAPQHPARSAARARLRDPGRRPPGACPTCGRWCRTPTPGSPTRCGPFWPRPRARSASSRRACARSSARSRRWRERATSVVRLRTIPGVGLLTATALVAFVGDVAALPVGPPLRELPRAHARETSSGLRRRLGAISKRGDPYLRMLLIHGARSVLLHAKKAERRTRSPAHLGARARARARPQQGRRRARQQARSDRLGRVAQRARLRHASGATKEASDRPTTDCFEHTTVMAHRS